MSSERAGFGQAALAQLPAELEAKTPTKKGAGQKRKPVEVPQVSRRHWQRRGGRQRRWSGLPAADCLLLGRLLQVTGHSQPSVYHPVSSPAGPADMSAAAHAPVAA